MRSHIVIEVHEDMLSAENKTKKQNKQKLGELKRWLRTLGALPEDSRSILVPTCLTTVPGDQMSFSGLPKAPDTEVVHNHPHGQNTHTQKRI